MFNYYRELTDNVYQDDTILNCGFIFHVMDKDKQTHTIQKISKGCGVGGVEPMTF